MEPDRTGWIDQGLVREYLLKLSVSCAHRKVLDELEEPRLLLPTTSTELTLDGEVSPLHSI